MKNIIINKRNISYMKIVGPKDCVETSDCLGFRILCKKGEKYNPYWWLPFYTKTAKEDMIECYSHLFVKTDISNLKMTRSQFNKIFEKEFLTNHRNWYYLFDGTYYRRPFVKIFMVNETDFAKCFDTVSDCEKFVENIASLKDEFVEITETRII